jgi:CheY-like chemotaxis protein
MRVFRKPKKGLVPMIPNTKMALIIDDESAMREFVTGVLDEAGYMVMSAENGFEGLALVKKGIPDLIITDLVMPDKDGLEVIMHLKSQNPNIKIIAMSGMANAETFLQIAEKLGAHAILQKPFRKMALLELVEKVMRE